jgi:probable HAF family extracellular repeat protein
MKTMAVTVLLIALLATARAQSKYIITEIGIGTPDGVSPTAINVRGQVVGQYQILNKILNTLHEFLYTNGRLLDLGTLPGTSASAAFGINDHGQICGISYTDTSLSSQAFVYANGYMQNLAPSGSLESWARSINNRGVIAGFFYPTSYSIPMSVIYDGTRSQSIVPNSSLALGINDSGQVVGTISANVPTPYVWTRGKIQYLPGVSGSSGSIGVAINNLGHVAGRSYIASSALYRTFLYRNGQTKDLDNNNTDYSMPYGINASDEVVGFFQPSVDPGDFFHPTARAFLYIDGQMKDLNAFLPKNSGWLLTAAAAINDVGQIVGTGLYNGSLRAYLLTPMQ